MPHCYILYSKTLDKFYIGSSILDPAERLQNHLTHYYGTSKFTARADDWEIFITIECIDTKQAHMIENHFKKMKSSKYIRNLSIYPEIIENLKKKYS